MSTLSLRLPNSIHRHIKQIATQEACRSISLFRLPCLKKFPPLQQRAIWSNGRKGRIGLHSGAYWIRYLTGHHCRAMRLRQIIRRDTACRVLTSRRRQSGPCLPCWNLPGWWIKPGSCPGFPQGGLPEQTTTAAIP